MKSYTLGLLLLSSVNALGHECYINVNDESAYVLQLSVYSYLNDINTCKCQSGYEFSPSISGGELSKKGSENFFFTTPSDLAGKQLQCVIPVIPKDGITLSTVEWAIPVSIFIIATGAVGSYSIYKLRGLRNPVSEDGGGIELTNSQIGLEESLGITRDNTVESANSRGVIGEPQQVPQYDYVRAISVAKIDIRPRQPIPGASNDDGLVYTQVVKSKVARQTEVVLKSFKQQGNEDTTIESSELLKNTTADPNLDGGPSLPARGYKEITKNLGSDTDIYKNSDADENIGAGENSSAFEEPSIYENVEFGACK
ncbi:hypothetical protein [bacterium endosymbiont of Bathymodiolus sp. 5 South]|nr:hypothetical protein [bacterium endosymbiont of Bathymodiolus sp. 5 South]